MLFDRLSYFFSISKNTLGSLNICKEISAVFSARPCSSFGVPLVQMILSFLIWIFRDGMRLSIHPVIVLAHRLSP